MYILYLAWPGAFSYLSFLELRCGPCDEHLDQPPLKRSSNWGVFCCHLHAIAGGCEEPSD